MEEFLRLFLTGKRAESYLCFRRIARALALLGVAVAVVPVILHFAGVKILPLTAAVSVLGGLGAVAGGILSHFERSYADGLAELQHAANAVELRGEELTRSEALYSAWKETFGKKGKRPAKAAARTLVLLGVAVLVASSIGIAAGALGEEWGVGACFVFSLFGVVGVWIGVYADGALTAKLYERAGREIDETKRALGRDERRIGREEERARAFSALPRTVELFLCEKEDRAEFCRLQKKSMIAGMIFGVLAVLSFILPLTFQEVIGTTAAWCLVGSLIALGIGALFLITLPLRRRTALLYERNGIKLQGDERRSDLQRRWMALQKWGNGIFLLLSALSVVLGAVLGGIGYAFDPTLNLAEQIGVSVTIFLLFLGLIGGTVVWLVFYSAMRRGMKRVETELLQAEREGANG